MSNSFNFIGEDFYNNKNVCRKTPITMEVGQYVLVIDPDIIDPETNKYSEVVCQCIKKVPAKHIPNRYYYYLVAVRSKNNEILNTKESPNVPCKYYKLLEWTSPYLGSIIYNNIPED